MAKRSQNHSLYFLPYFAEYFAKVRSTPPVESNQIIENWILSLYWYIFQVPKEKSSQKTKNGDESGVLSRLL